MATTTVTATYLNPSGNPARGSVTFRLVAATYSDGLSAIFPTVPVRADLDADGAISVELQPTSGVDADFDSTTMTYEVRERINGADRDPYYVDIPSEASVDLGVLTTYDDPPLSSRVLVTPDLTDIGYALAEDSYRVINVEASTRASLEAAVAEAAAGDIVCLDGRTITLDAAMAFDALDGITFLGPGTITAKDETTAIVVFTDSTNLRFDQITFHGVRTPGTWEPSTDGGYGVVLSGGCENVTFEGCRFTTFHESAIVDRTEYGTGVEDSDVRRAGTIITGCRFDVCGEVYNTKAGGTRGLVFTGNQITACEGAVKIDGEDVAGTTTDPAGVAVIANNVWTDCTGPLDTESALIMIEDNAWDVLITGNQFHRIENLIGIRGQDGQTDLPGGRVTITNNSFVEFTATGAYNASKCHPIFFRNEVAETLYDVTITGNRFHTTSMGAIYFDMLAASGVKGLRIRDNEFVDLVSTGTVNASWDDWVRLNLLGDFDSVDVSGNVFDRRNTPTSVGFILLITGETTKTQTELVMHGNTFLAASELYAVQLSEIESAVLTGNHFRFSTVQVEGSGCGVILTGNHFRDSPLRIADVTGVVTCRASGNTWSRTGGSSFGVRLANSSLFYGAGNLFDESFSGIQTVFASSGTVYSDETVADLWRHRANKLGFFGSSGTTRPSSYTQTYATADRTLSAYTPVGQGTPYTGAADSEAKLSDLNNLRAAYENLRAFTEDLAQLTNSILDDLQGFGILN